MGWSNLLHTLFTHCTYFTRNTHYTHRYELAWKMSKDSKDLLWWAIIGHTALYLLKKIEDNR